MTQFVPHPAPLHNCPGRPLWEPYRGEEWLLFADESFFEFFELANDRGYLCHGALGVPARRYDELKSAFEPLFRDYRTLTSPGQSEFKHAVFKTIEFPARRRLALRMRDVLARHGCFVTGFYTPLRSFVLERVRLNVSDTMDAVPADHADLYAAATAELRAELPGPGAAGVLARFMSYPVGAVSNMLAFFDCRFRLYFDPREASEDRAVEVELDDFMRASQSVFENLGDRYLGATYDRSSQDELGLQLADIVAGEVRHFFQANAPLASFKSSLALITERSVEPIQVVREMHGRPWKIGALHRMPAPVANCFSRPDPQGRYVFPFFRNLLASGSLSCYAQYGHPRQLMPFERAIFDQVE
jgi:hypothetical protein